MNERILIVFTCVPAIIYFVLYFIVLKKERKMQLWYDQSKDDLRKTELYCYSVMESYLFLYDHYKIIASLLASSLAGQDNIGLICTNMAVAQDNMLKIENEFFKIFKMTPEQYRNSQEGMKAKKQDGGDFTTNFSKN